MKSRKVGIRNATASCNESKKNHQQQTRMSRSSCVRQLKENIGLVYYHARRWAASARRCGVSIDDLISAGMLGLWYGTLKYSPGKGMRYPVYVTGYIKSYIKCEFNKLAKHQTVSLSKVLYENDNGEPVTLEDVLPGENGMETAVNKSLVNDILGYLNDGVFRPFDSRLFQMRNGIGLFDGEKPMSLSEVRKAINCDLSREAIRRKTDKVLIKLKTLMNGNDMLPSA